MINFQDVRDYLATKKPEDVVAVTNQVQKCLIAETVRWKFKVAFVIVEDMNTGADFRLEGLREYRHVEVAWELTQLAKKFDVLGPTNSLMRHSQIEVTRARLEEEFPVLKQGGI